MLTLTLRDLEPLLGTGGPHMPHVAAGGASSPMISWTWSWWQQALSVDAPCKFSSMIKSVTLRSHEHQDSGQHQKEHLHGGEWRIEASDQFGGQRACPQLAGCVDTESHQHTRMR